MNTTTDFNAAERVKAGAAYLDDQDPGWVNRIDLNRLDLGSDCGCILGQLDGSYWEAVEWRLLDRSDRVGLGFTATIGSFDTEWEALQDAWHSLIADRRTQAAR